MGPLRIIESAGYDNFVLVREDKTGKTESIIAHVPFLISYHYPTPLLAQVALDIDEQVEYEDQQSGRNEPEMSTPVLSVTAPDLRTTGTPRPKRTRTTMGSAAEYDITRELVVEPRQRPFWSFDPRNAATLPVAPPAVSAPESTSAPSRLSITGYFAERRRRHGPSPMEDVGDVAQAPQQPPRAMSSLRTAKRKGRSKRVSSGAAHSQSIPERPAGLLALRELSEARDPPPGTVDSSMEESVVTNDLDEAQSRQVALELQAPVSRRLVARPLLTPIIRDYGFQPRDPAETARHAASQLLNTYVIGPAARIPEELTQRAALHERFLTPQVTSLSEYRERLRVQGQRCSVPPMRTYPVALQPGGDSTEYDSRFELWVEKSRRLSSMEALRASFSDVDACLERRLRFDYAKLRAKRRLLAGFQSRPRVGDIRYAPLSPSASPVQTEGIAMARRQTRSVGADPAAPQLIAGKREATDDAVASPRGAVDLSDQKRPRRQGNPGGGALQTPMSFPSGGSHSTLPDTGYAHGTDGSLEYVPRGSGNSPARQVTPEAAFVLPQSPLPRSGAVAELSQSLSQLRLLVQDVDQRVYRYWDDIDSLHQRLDWVQVPRELWDHIRGLDARVAALEHWVPYWQDSVRRDEETQRTLAVLRGQIDLLARLREAPPGHYPVTVPMGSPAASSAHPPSASVTLLTPGPRPHNN
ncbi:unnamed protein product [Phytophthora fragariaefolia]|uniref:Unnamed protein product n=1 Tax=Phytophthora fragariaefolia TaxID=1490495 RepID=A0A9W6TLJ5_9STRA|nr:unnamed protein product [Phytophthora fragariaefolia]